MGTRRHTRQVIYDSHVIVTRPNGRQATGDRQRAMVSHLISSHPSPSSSSTQLGPCPAGASVAVSEGGLGRGVALMGFLSGRVPMLQEHDVPWAWIGVAWSPGLVTR